VLCNSTEKRVLSATFHSTRATFAERLGRADSKQTNGEAKETTAGTGQYKPYGYLPTNTVGDTCDVQRWLDGTEIPEGIEFQYRFLYQIAYSGEEEIRLFLPDCIVVIEGRHLRELRKKLSRRQVTFVQQYSMRIWSDRPCDGDAIIEKIQIVRPNSLEPQKR